MASRKVSPKANFRLEIKHGVAIGPGKAELLGHIAELGSISAAGKAMGMSYRTAWGLVQSMNELFKKPLVVVIKGGASGGGASLTSLGAEVLARYRAMQARALKAVADDVAYFESIIHR